jgi:hypothetical protein
MHAYCRGRYFIPPLLQRDRRLLARGRQTVTVIERVEIRNVDLAPLCPSTLRSRYDQYGLVKQHVDCQVSFYCARQHAPNEKIDSALATLLVEKESWWVLPRRQPGAADIDGSTGQ